jgi:hypothetical protein
MVSEFQSGRETQDPNAETGMRAPRAISSS